MTDERQITTVAYRLNPNLEHLPLSFHQLRFPASWKPKLLDLQREVSGRRNGKVSIPIWSLNAAFRALVPDLIAISPRAAYGDDCDWLVSKEPIDTSVLHLIASAWARSKFQATSQSNLHRALSSMGADDLQWTADRIDATAADIPPNGTADPHQHTYNVLPNHLAWCIETANEPITCGGEPLRFRRMALDPGSSGAELVSWPPIRAGSATRYGYFSFTIRLTIQTVAFQSWPALYVHVGTRRWVTQPTHPPSGKTTVVLLTSVPWITGLSASHSLQGASVHWLPPDNGNFRLAWADGLPAILESLQIGQFPDPNALIEQPEKWLRRSRGVVAGIVYREAMQRPHAVGAGVSADERRKLVEQLNCILERQGFSLAAPLRPACKINFAVRNPFFPSKAEQLKTETAEDFEQRKGTERLVRIGQACQKRLDLEIHYQSDSVLRALERSLQEILGNPAKARDDWEWRTNDLHVRLRTRQLGAIGSPLELPSGRRNISDRIEVAAQSRVKSVQSVLATVPDSPSGAIIELAGPDAFKKSNNDPKGALRAAFSTTNRLSQFITPRETAESEENLLHRAKASWHDLFRQLGVCLKLPDAAVHGLPTAIKIVGLWLIKRARAKGRAKRAAFLPVATYFDTRDSIVYAKVNGLDGLYVYPEALVAIGRGEGRFVEYERDAITFVKEVLDELSGAGDTLVLCDKHNFGRTWPWLYNKHIETDYISFGNQPAIPIAEYAGVRIIRVRGESSSYETPEWYQAKGRETKLPRGLWRVSDRVFGSTYGKPAQAQGASQYTSKVGPWTNSRDNSFSAKPQVHLPNPAFYELTAACLQPGDDSAAWAALAHMLRSSALHYGEATARPNPLLLAERMEEYAIPFDISGCDSQHQSGVRTAKIGRCSGRGKGQA